MTRRVRPRPGLSLTEVLVAMFMMAVGMIAIFTLFPLGAMQVGQALRDDRTSQTAQQARGYMNDLWRNQVATPLAAGQQPTEPFFWAMYDPNQWCDAPPTYIAANMARTPKLLRSGGVYGNSFLPAAQQLPAGNGAPAGSGMISPTMLSQDTVATAPPNTPASTTAGDPNINITYSNATFGGHPGAPTYPVLVDPIGFAARVLPDQAWAARTAAASGGTRILLPRRQLNAAFSNPSVSNQQQAAFQIAGMTDDVLFRPEGRPPTSSEDVMTRQGRYSWAAIVQRKDSDRKDVADLTVLAFDGRSRLPAIGASMSASNDEYVTAPVFGQSAFDRQVTVQLPARGSDDPVLIRRGGWVMDGTIDSLPFTATPAVPVPRRYAYFYRITGVVENADGTTTLDLETPLQKPLVATPVASTDPPASQLYFFAGLAEVFPDPSSNRRWPLGQDVNY